jgi:hypothetical protein
MKEARKNSADHNFGRVIPESILNAAENEFVDKTYGQRKRNIKSVSLYAPPLTAKRV